MLVTMAVFDAYGAGFEFTNPAFVKKHHTLKGYVLKGYVQHPKHKGIKPGWYTDDTQMAAALAELMLTKNPDEWRHEDLARSFIEGFRQAPRKGYSGGFYQILRHCAGCADGVRAQVFLKKILPHSDKNGGAMRAGPIGLLPNMWEVIDRAMFQASLTHATRLGMGAAAASALMVHYLHHKIGPKADLPEFLETFVPGFHWDVPWRANSKVGTLATQAVSGALWAIVRSATLVGVLRRCVAYGGDTDTVAAIAGCAASRSTEIAQFFPPALHEGLEDGTYGRRFLSQLDDRLLTRFPRAEEPETAEEEVDLIGDLFDAT